MEGPLSSEGAGAFVVTMVDSLSDQSGTVMIDHPLYYRQNRVSVLRFDLITPTQASLCIWNRLACQLQYLRCR